MTENIEEEKKKHSFYVKRKRDPSKDYIDKKKFTDAVIVYVTDLKASVYPSNSPPPDVSNYVAKCFMDISTKMSTLHNFSQYTYREEMVMDAVENCLKAIKNFDDTAPTRAGTPNAFGYFSQIIYWAFLRRIEKENKQLDIKAKFKMMSPVDEFLVQSDNSPGGKAVAQNYLNVIRGRIDRVRETDLDFKDWKKSQKELEDE